MAESIFRDQDQYSCSICLDLMTDPVTIPCGHSYCMTCIKDYWDKDDYRKNNCPQCRQRFLPRPALNKNTILAEIMEKLRKNDFQVSSNATMLAELEYIECDFCTGKKVRAVNSCLECRASYCEMHLQPHFDFPALKKHKLVNATNMLSCPKHDKLLEVFCRTDQNCICMLCLMDDHKGHDTVSSATERDEKQIRLQADRIKLEEKRKGKEHELHDLQKDQKTRIDAAQQAVESTTKAFTATADLMKKKCSEIIEKIQAQEKADLDRLNGLQEQLELEIAILRGHEDDLDKLLQTADNIHFLQNFEKMPTSSGAEDFPTHSLEPAFSFGDIRNILSEFKDSLEVFCKKEVEKILEKVSNVATTASLCHIKTGDRVRVKSCVNTPIYNWGLHVTHKSIGVVKAVDGKQVTVDFPECSGWRGIVPEMEVVSYAPSGSSSANCSFDIGCKVRVKPSVVTPKYQWGGITHKSIGIVKAVEEGTVFVDFPEFHAWKGELSEMELISSKESACLGSNIQIGDRVQVKATVDTPKHGWGEVSRKSVGVVTAMKGEDITVNFPEQKRWLGVLSEVEFAASAN
ncbi:E3 ubiquitin/ISG15 ligase TRIM25 isoform X2 [Electrophorus electricus]|uniref:E3 ubiquitin/ISG15 ligase TRIM25 isoform X2 n=1 Tax=Electrophorus electricus TaxID=8005 RepID=UPI0015CFAB31|nr:E3 ubiquitin/ISG15 ligase TRIM25 isoform X2 [Electrophorus electricus]